MADERSYTYGTEIGTWGELRMSAYYAGTSPWLTGGEYLASVTGSVYAWKVCTFVLGLLTASGLVGLGAGGAVSDTPVKSGVGYFFLALAFVVMVSAFCWMRATRNDLKRKMLSALDVKVQQIVDAKLRARGTVGMATSASAGAVVIDVGTSGASGSAEMATVAAQLAARLKPGDTLEVGDQTYILTSDRQLKPLAASTAGFSK